MYDKLKSILWWFAVPPALIAFWSLVGAAVHFQDRVEFVLETVTEEAQDEFISMRSKVDYLWVEAGGDMR